MAEMTEIIIQNGRNKNVMIGKTEITTGMSDQIEILKKLNQ